MDISGCQRWDRVGDRPGVMSSGVVWSYRCCLTIMMGGWSRMVGE